MLSHVNKVYSFNDSCNLLLAELLHLLKACVTSYLATFLRLCLIVTNFKTAFCTLVNPELPVFSQCIRILAFPGNKKFMSLVIAEKTTVLLVRDLHSTLLISRSKVLTFLLQPPTRRPNVFHYRGT